MVFSKESWVMLFLNVSASCNLLFLFLYVFSTLFSKFFSFLCRKTRQSGDDEFEVESSTEEDPGFFQVECTDREDLVADIIRGGEELLSFSVEGPHKDEFLVEEGILESDLDRDAPENSDEYFITDSNYGSPTSELQDIDVEDDAAENLETEDTGPKEDDLNPPFPLDPNDNRSKVTDEAYEGEEWDGNEEAENANEDSKEINFSADEEFLSFAPAKLDAKSFPQAQEKDHEEIFGDSFTVGSTSKSSSEWRSSINNRDSGTDDPFSSSSRRSCPKWESYTVFQKYDEEMMFLDRISAQKLHETESFRAIQACPRSISERIVLKLSTGNKKSSSDTCRNPYHELESAYVAQICLTWEALNWNYKYFQRLRASKKEADPGCPAQVAQQFQQFQVLLQRYIENEPYEHGRRPEVYARMRISAPKLLQVPEFRDDQKDDGFGSKVSSDTFLLIMKEAIGTFMNFLKADRESHCQILSAFFRRNRRSSVDLTLLHLLKKANKKKKMKLKDLRRTRKCLTKRKLKEDEEMERLMGLIDLKVVSRVLRMTEISEVQLHWCQDKMSKVRLWQGKLQRDSTPLFFPAH